ncbi:MAG TPA: non-homologous end-joining DNA ligase [Acidimicrobiales bacterium]|jgi:bifunctional non-homologous end joining protein LigD|nr:non-homologous end-joining DNA ligase [Acidimicrobiales bacterium]
MARSEVRVSVGGRELTLSNLNKVLFPETGFTKGQLIDYYVKVAPAMLPHIAGRPVTLKRYPNGVDEKFFYEKHVPAHAPDWVRTAHVASSDSEKGIDYVVIDDLPTLAWAANLGSIELHVPLWSVGRRRVLPAPPDLLVFDLDPGEGATIVECCTVAELVRDVLEGASLDCRPKTSGSKGMQIYAPLPGRPTWEKTRAQSREIAEQLERQHPELIVSNMRKTLRRGKVLIDWSQNHQSKTTVGVYSVRARQSPTVSTPVTWDEITHCQKSGDPSVLEFTTDQVLERIDELGDLFSFGHTSATKQKQAQALKTYRSKRDPAKTPEPMGGTSSTGSHPSFVIQEHHARALHWDFRLEHNGVLVSWALPKGVPQDPKTNHLAVHTEDHPMDYGSFEGSIPQGEYGGGDVRIWDHGHYELEKWRANEVMVVLHGSKVSGRYVLFPTDGKNWMIHRMDPAPEDYTPLPERVRPMLATPGKLPSKDGDWAYEIKWDGVRAIAYVDGGRVRLQSRNDKDLTAAFPDFRELGATIGARPCILDGEIVVLGEDGKPNFGLLQRRLHVVNTNAIKKLAADYPASYVIFDVMHLDGRRLTGLPYDDRRKILEELNLSGGSFTTAESFRDVSGADILRATVENGLEGVIAKRRDSLYLEGKRNDTWVKVKNIQTQEVVIGGWTEGAGNRTGSIGALLLGIPAGRGLRYVGKVGTGFNERDRKELLDLLGPVTTKKSPFVPASDVSEPAPPHFVRPKIVGEVQYAAWTMAGHLRHPSWRGLRPDKEPSDVVVEE